MAPEQQFQLLAVSALIDGCLAPEEKELLLKAARGLGLAVSDAQRILKGVAGGGAKPIAAPEDPVVSARLFESVVELLIADQQLHPREEAFLQRIAPEFGQVPDEALQLARARVAQVSSEGLEGGAAVPPLEAPSPLTTTDLALAGALFLSGCAAFLFPRLSLLGLPMADALGGENTHDARVMSVRFLWSETGHAVPFFWGLDLELHLGALALVCGVLLASVALVAPALRTSKLLTRVLQGLGLFVLTAFLVVRLPTTISIGLASNIDGDSSRLPDPGVTSQIASQVFERLERGQGLAPLEAPDGAPLRYLLFQPLGEEASPIPTRLDDLMQLEGALLVPWQRDLTFSYPCERTELLDTARKGWQAAEADSLSAQRGWPVPEHPTYSYSIVLQPHHAEAFRGRRTDLDPDALVEVIVRVQREPDDELAEASLTLFKTVLCPRAQR